MDGIGTPLSRVCSVGKPRPIVLNEPRVREIHESEDRPVRLAAVTRILIWLRDLPVSISILCKAVGFGKVNRESDGQSNQGDPHEAKCTHGHFLTGTPWSRKETLFRFFFEDDHRLRFQ